MKGQITAIVMTNTNNSNRTVVLTPAEIAAVGEILLGSGWTGEYDERFLFIYFLPSKSFLV